MSETRRCAHPERVKLGSVMVLETVETPDGPFSVLTEPDGAVRASGWTATGERLIARLAARERPDGVRAGRSVAGDAVRAYYEGDPGPAAVVVVRRSGTALQRRGWERMRGIPAGEVLSYAAFATELGAPAAVRAAAGICARNPAALFVPCHRVVRSDGSPGGFAWGAPVKQTLLAREAEWRAGVPR